MFTKPKNGWTEIHLEDFEGLGSYIQDIPVMVLDRGVQSVQERTPLKLWFDEEESAFTLTADEETKIVTEGEFGAEEYNIKCSKLDLIREIKNDIENIFRIGWPFLRSTPTPRRKPKRRKFIKIEKGCCGGCLPSWRRHCKNIRNKFIFIKNR